MLRLAHALAAPDPYGLFLQGGGATMYRCQRPGCAHRWSEGCSHRREVEYLTSHGTPKKRCLICGRRRDLPKPPLHSPSMTQNEATPSAKQRFIQELAQYLVGNQAAMSIGLAMEDPQAIQWARIRQATPLFGYPTVEEAEEILTKFLA